MFGVPGDYKRPVAAGESVMLTAQDSNRKAKIAAAEHAAGLVETGMRVGLGTGSTSAFLVEAIGRRMREESLHVAVVATSKGCDALARAAGMVPEDSNDIGRLDMTIDGADECNHRLDLIKGGGGALLTEKIVAENSDRMVVIADSSKMSEHLGSFPLPVEVAKFGWRSTNSRIRECLKSMGFGDVPGNLRMAREGSFVSQEGNFILDYRLGWIEDPSSLHSELISIAGVLETGLFPGMCDLAILGDNDGSVATFSVPVGIKD